MGLPKEVLSARDQIAEHLAQFDWSSLTNGKRNVLQTFLTIASAQGYAAVTMRSLAKALNIKAPSIYSHFPDGKDDIVAECLRWHYYNFGIAMLDVIDTIDDTEQLFNKMVNVHFTRQVTIPESELWDMLVASDRAGQFLRSDIREEIYHWLGLCENLYLAVAKSLNATDLDTSVKLLLNILDGDTSWCKWDGTTVHLDKLNQEMLDASKRLLAIK